MSETPEKLQADLDRYRQEAAAAWMRLSRALKDRDEAQAERTRISDELARVRAQLELTAQLSRGPNGAASRPGSGSSPGAASGLGPGPSSSSSSGSGPDPGAVPSPSAPPARSSVEARDSGSAAAGPAAGQATERAWATYAATLTSPAGPGHSGNGADSEALRREVERSHVEIADLRMQLTRKTTECDEQRLRAEQNFAEQQRVRGQVTELVAERDAARAMAQTYRERLAALEADALSGRDERKYISEEIEFLKFALDRTVNEYAGSRQSLMQERDQARHETDELRRRLDNCIANSAKMILEWKERAVRAEQTLAEIGKRIGPLIDQPPPGSARPAPPGP